MRRHWVPSRGVGRAWTQSRSPGQGQAREGVVPGSARTHRAPGEQRGGTGGGPSKGPEILGQGQGPPEEQPGLKQGARPWKGTPRVRALLDSRTQGKGQGLGGKGGQAMAQGEVGSRHRSTAGGGVWWGVVGWRGRGRAWGAGALGRGRAKGPGKARGRATLSPREPGGARRPSPLPRSRGASWQRGQSGKGVWQGQGQGQCRPRWGRRGGGPGPKQGAQPRDLDGGQAARAKQGRPRASRRAAPGQGSAREPRGAGRRAEQGPRFQSPRAR